MINRFLLRGAALVGAALLTGCSGTGFPDSTDPDTTTTATAAVTTLPEPSTSTADSITTTSGVATTTTIERDTTTTLAPLPPGTELGEILVRDADGLEMVWIPGATFTMGRDPDDPQTGPAETPSHQVTLSGYWIDRTEVTNAAYGLCVAAGRCGPGRYGTGASDLPAVGVSWGQAAEYCSWAGVRLPTEAQWEYAARGPEGLIYPWGDEFEPARANLCDVNCTEDWADPAADDGYAEAAPVGSYPDGAGWAGTLDQSGNVWEWVHDWHSPYTGAALVDPRGPGESPFGQVKVIRGGAWASPPEGATGSYRIEGGGDLAWTARHPNIGFRCAAGSDPASEG